VIAHAGSTPALTTRSARLPTAAFLTAVAGGAWWWTIEDAREMSGMIDGFVKVGRAMPWDISPVGFAGTWTVMMTAMMLPGVIPVMTALRNEELPFPLTGAVWASGCLGMWVSTGAIALGALVALNEVGQPSPWLQRAGGTLIVLAGMYQFTGWKRRLLQRNGDYDQILSVRSVFGAGLSHGLRCLSASWALMSVLLVVGVMNVAWMAALSAICMGEQASSRRTALATVVGVMLVGFGLVVLVEPGELYVIAGIG
jgi:predicted metal-binding membrane protein